MWNSSISLLKRRGVKLEAGLTAQEIAQIEATYNIRFPQSLRQFLMAALPVSEGFYNWRNLGSMDSIKAAIQAPKAGILACDVSWCDQWGEKPEEAETEKIIRERLEAAPVLLPVYGHRYMPMLPDDNPPIVSVHGTDVIYYGETLADYFAVEFGGKKQREIDTDKIKTIPFWSDIM